MLRYVLVIPVFQDFLSCSGIELCQVPFHYLSFRDDDIISDLKLIYVQYCNY